MRFSGLKASNGFWKIGCTLLHEGEPLAAAADRRKIGALEADACPRSAAPCSASCAASVVLPLPDSPMIVKISGRPGLEREAHAVDRVEPPAGQDAAHRVGLGDPLDLEQARRSRRRLRRHREAGDPAPGRRPAPAAGSAAGRPPSRAGSADGSGSRAAGRRDWAARPRAPAGARHRRSAAGSRSDAGCRDAAARGTDPRSGPPRRSGRRT